MRVDIFINAQIKSKQRNRLNLENDLILCVANTDPRWEELINQEQEQPWQ